MTFRNLKDYDGTVTSPPGFYLKIQGVINPAGTLTQGLKAFIIQAETQGVGLHALFYAANLGALTFTAPPAILLMTNLIVASQNTREKCQYSFSLTPTIDASFSAVYIDFQKEYVI